MAERVGASGTVYAVDIQPEMIELLQQQMTRRGAANVNPSSARRAIRACPPAPSTSR